MASRASDRALDRGGGGARGEGPCGPYGPAAPHLLVTTAAPTGAARPGQISFMSLPTFVNAAIARSTSAASWPAEICTRMRASPFGTTG